MSKKTTDSLFSYPTARAFVTGMKKQSLGDYKNIKSYFRSGFPQLADIETQVAKLLNVEEKQGESLLLTNSGMSAVATALDIAHLSKDDIIIHGQVEYSKIYDYINEDLPKREVIPVEVDVADISAIDKALKKYPQVRVVFLETVGNGPSMPVLDIEKFFKLKSLRRANPLIIIDNTLPTDSLLPLLPYLRKNSDLTIIAVQSATKFYLRNEDTGGMLYVVSRQLRDTLVVKRTRIGATPGPALVELFRKTLAGKKQFDYEIQTFVRNTGLLAYACKEADGAGKKFLVGYPNLPRFPKGIAPVFFLTPGTKTTMSAEDLFYKLEKEGAFADMIITESFGFKKTGVSHSARLGGYIRIGGGLEPRQKIVEIGKRLADGLQNL
ncbi:aminotransferase class I/II-fold pyridoxal phosphate-dependent enzyme [Candidatus Microgenomates bacterium]|nr:aminotransferase class I/II-fold pyridoxal phosphate-dependent enzyme [Candidatus Microgenomates bacterium]